MRPELCEGCNDCPLRARETCAPPSGPENAKVLVVGEAPGREEAEQEAPFVGASGRLLRSALKQFDLDPETEVRFVNTVQCQPEGNADPEPIALARCTVLEQELRAFQGRVVLAVGKIALERLVGTPFVKSLTKSRSAWDGYVHPFAERVDLGYELADQGEVYKSGKRKGEPKLTKRLLSAQVPTPPNALGVVACLHPAFVMRTGFSNKAQFLAAVQRASLVASGHAPLGHADLAGLDSAVERPHEWIIPDNADEMDLVFDIENTKQGITDISFVEVRPDETLGQRASFTWTPATRGLAERLLGRDSPYGNLVAHNAAYDCGQLDAMAQVQVRGAGLGERGVGLADTMMAAQIDQPDLPKALGAMWRYLPPMPAWKQLSGADMRLYNLLDSVVTAMVWVQLRRRLAENGQRSLLRDEMASIMVLDRMSRNGLPVDVGRLDLWLEETAKAVAKRHEQWVDLTGLEAHTGKRVLELVFGADGWACPVLKRTEKTGAPKFDEDVIEKLLEADVPPQAKKALRVNLEWRKLNKQLKTYGEGYANRLDERGYLHPSYLPDIKDSGDLGTAAGRLSSSPNVQNVPKDLRWMFKAPTGWAIGDSDLRAVEGRVQAVLAEDHELLAMYDRPGFDMHRYNLRNAREALRQLWLGAVDERTAGGAVTAFAKKVVPIRLEALKSRLWPISRRTMKTFLYGWNYGAGDAKIAESLGIHKREAIAIREGYEASRPATARWRKQVVCSAASRRFLQNAFGRRRYFPGVVPDANVRNQAINFFPQSTVADMMWTWFPRIEELLAANGGHLITQVHDSFVWMAPMENVHKIVADLDVEMTCEWPQIAPGFSVPATHDVGLSWGEVEPYQEDLEWLVP